MATVPPFEVVVDHRDPSHHARMDQWLDQLLAWGKRHRVRHVRREMTELRPGVMRVRFTPDLSGGAARPAGDRLTLSTLRR